jgi:hypothetical protein
MRGTWLVWVFWTVIAASALAQTPQPFPRAGQQPPPPSARPPAPSPPPAAVPSAPPAAVPPAPPAAADPATPTEATLGFAIYPGAQFIASYDAGRGQRYYIFGSTATFNDLVAYYRTQLKDKGNLVFQDPPTHTFEIGKFNNDTMAFPPGVTIKDYTSGGSQGYPNPKPRASPVRFPTLIQIVPVPPGTGRP